MHEAGAGGGVAPRCAFELPRRQLSVSVGLVLTNRGAAAKFAPLLARSVAAEVMPLACLSHGTDATTLIPAILSLDDIILHPPFVPAEHGANGSGVRDGDRGSDRCLTVILRRSLPLCACRGRLGRLCGRLRSRLRDCGNLTHRLTEGSGGSAGSGGWE